MSISETAWPATDPADAPGSPAPRAGIPVRLLAGAVGLAALLTAGLFTLGAALAAPLGMGLAAWVLRRRGRRLSRLGSWAAGMGAASVAIALGFALLFASLPEGAWSEAMAAAESAEPPPRPEWLERIAPASAQPNPTLEGIVASRPAAIYFGLVGMALGCLMLGSFAGTLGWAAAFLLGFAARGQWPLRQEAG